MSNAVLSILVAVSLAVIPSWYGFTRMKYPAASAPPWVINVSLTALVALSVGALGGWATVVGVNLLKLMPALGFAGLVAVWLLWEAPKQPSPPAPRRYVRAKVDRMREALTRLRIEWGKFPGGLPEASREQVLDEFHLAADDFMNDPALGRELRLIDSHATVMIRIASQRYLAAHGPMRQMEGLYDHGQVLIPAAINLLNATAHLVIYEDEG